MVRDGQRTTDAIKFAAEEIELHGFAYLPGSAFPDRPDPASLRAFSEHWNDLPVDNELLDGGNYRRRRYGRLHAVVTADTVTYEPLEHVAFRQDTNPLYPGRDRMFEPIVAAALEDEALRALVTFDVMVAERLRGLGSWEVGLHQIRIIARDGALGRPTPEGRHRDGHVFVGMHLLNRTDCDGGLSIIQFGDQPPTEFTLQDRLDSVIVDDQAVTHEVTPISATGGTGIRDMLLVDLNPWR